MKTIAIIGTGIMGSGMAANFLNHKYKVVVWNRDRQKLKSLIQKGAVAAQTPREAASMADIVFEVTANDDSSRVVWLGNEGILAGAGKSTMLIASGTFSLEWIGDLAHVCIDRKLTFFDMPLTGGRSGAESGTLVLLAGGSKAKLDKLKPVLRAISGEVLYFGKLGSGTKFKLVLNALQAMHMAALGEALKIAKVSGLDLQKAGDALAQRPGGTTTKAAWRDFQKAPKPINFAVRWIIKDLLYAKELADGVPTPLLDETLEKFMRLTEKRMDDEDWTTVNLI